MRVGSQLRWQRLIAVLTVLASAFAYTHIRGSHGWKRNDEQEFDKSKNANVRLGCRIYQSRIQKTGRTRVFYSIPFAHAPVGSLRWKPPKLVKVNDGCPKKQKLERVAIPSKRAICWQVSLGVGAPVPNTYQTENCLNLDVYVPIRRKKKKLPVLVFFYGGSSFLGSNAQYDFGPLVAATNGEFIAVVPNYRLGVLGYLTLMELSQESPHHASGNYGIMDAIGSLKWIKKHISKFGGNPNDITIMGQSSGGTLEFALVASPLARNLFRRAIIMSASSNISMPATEAQKTNQEIVRNAGCVTNSSRAVLSCLRSKSARELVFLTPASWIHYSYVIMDVPSKAFIPGIIVVDGYVLPYSLPKALKMGVNPVELLVSYMEQESALAPAQNVSNMTNLNDFLSYLNSQLVSYKRDFATGLYRMSPVFQQYWRSGGPQKFFDSFTTYARGICGGFYIAKTASTSAKFNAPVYFRLSKAGLPQSLPGFQPGGTIKYAFHALDLLLGLNQTVGINLTPAVKKYQGLYQNQWQNFITEGVPGKDWHPFAAPDWYVERMFRTYVEDEEKFLNGICSYFFDHGVFMSQWWAN